MVLVRAGTTQLAPNAHDHRVVFGTTLPSATLSLHT